MTEERQETTCEDVEVTPVDSTEYEFAAVATATVTGPHGTVRLHRRYEGLPYHNDVVDPDAVDSNDELVDRPDEIHVHTKAYALDADREDYLYDAHETWAPRDGRALAAEAAFLAACREHHLAGVRRAYDRASEEHRRE